MRLRYGPYAGMTTEVLLLRAGDYAAWTMAHRPQGAVAQAFASLLAAFDERPLTGACACGAPAARVLSYRSSAEPIVVCEACADRLRAAGMVDDVTTYLAALEHVMQTFPRGIRRQQRKIIRNLGRAKGLPRRVTERSADAFFSGLVS